MNKPYGQNAPTQAPATYESQYKQAQYPQAENYQLLGDYQMGNYQPSQHRQPDNCEQLQYHQNQGYNKLHSVYTVPRRSDWPVKSYERSNATPHQFPSSSHTLSQQSYHQQSHEPGNQRTRPLLRGRPFKQRASNNARQYPNTVKQGVFPSRVKREPVFPLRVKREPVFPSRVKRESVMSQRPIKPASAKPTRAPAAATITHATTATDVREALKAELKEVNTLEAVLKRKEQLLSTLAEQDSSTRETSAKEAPSSSSGEAVDAYDDYK